MLSLLAGEIKQMYDEDHQHHHRADAMNVTGRFEAPQQVRQRRSPRRIRKFQGHACHGKTHEADDHDRVQNAFQAGEPAKLQDPYPGRRRPHHHRRPVQ